MARILLTGILLLVICGSASAQQAQAFTIQPDLIQLVITGFGVLFAARLAYVAFGRRAVLVADVPTFPKYMTSRTQYRIGSWLFVAFACAFFFLLVYKHRDVVAIPGVSDLIPKAFLDAIRDPSPSYVVILLGMGAVYFYFLTKEAEWNVLLIVRDLIYRWISIPQLAGQIVAQIRYSLRVPKDAIAAVVASSAGVAEQDFRKDPNTPDRLWAETCYMKWWLMQGLEAGEDSTFFVEESFGFDKLLGELEQTSRDWLAWKSGPTQGLALTGIFEKIKDLHNRFSRLVACYLIYRNGSRTQLRAETGKFGVELKQSIQKNPLRYWIVYVIVLIFAVYVGVYVSAIACDLIRGHGFNVTQDPQRAMQWIMYSLSNYGLAIVAILVLRSASGLLGFSSNQSHLVTYCWSFLVALAFGPLGLTIAVHFLSQSPIAARPFFEIYSNLLKWGWGPALVSIYISYYLDRQTYEDLPNIDHSAATIGWRLANCFGFASVTLVLMLPLLLSLNASSGSWDSIKLRAVAAGTTFCLTLALALAAQFALRQGTPTLDPVLSPRTSG